MSDASDVELEVNERRDAWRKKLISTLAILFFIASTYEIVMGREHWPLSSYPMFSKTRTAATLLHHAIVAVPADGSEPFPLYRSEHLHPFGWYRQRRGLREMLKKKDGLASANVALADCLRRYDQGRLEGRHDGPPLAELRLYRVDWVFDPRSEDSITSEDQKLVAVLRTDNQPQVERAPAAEKAPPAQSPAE